jgi:hypothetical protein
MPNLITSGRRSYRFCGATFQRARSLRLLPVQLRICSRVTEKLLLTGLRTKHARVPPSDTCSRVFGGVGCHRTFGTEFVGRREDMSFLRPNHPAGGNADEGRDVLVF